MAFCRTGEYPIHFEESGRGLPVILVHGHSLDLRAWDEMVPELVSGGLRVIRYDVRGHGTSGAPDSGYRWDAYVRDLKALVSHLGVQESVLVGFSVGGGIALAFAQEYPERVAALALVCSALPGFGYSDELSAQIAALQERIRAEGVHPTIENEFPGFALFDRIRSDADAMDRVHAMIGGYSGKEYLAEPEEQEIQVIERLASMTVPVLVVSAAGDMPDFGLIAALLAEQIPGAERKEFDAGHMLPMEQPKELAAALLAFIKERAISPLKR